MSFPVPAKFAQFCHRLRRPHSIAVELSKLQHQHHIARLNLSSQNFTRLLVPLIAEQTSTLPAPNSTRAGSRLGYHNGFPPRARSWRPLHTGQSSCKCYFRSALVARPYKLTGYIGHTAEGTVHLIPPPSLHTNSSPSACRSRNPTYTYNVDLQFKKLLAPGKIGQILCLGNITDKETFEFLRGIAPDLQIVKGDFDVEAPNLALSKVVTHGSLRIGFTHGHTIIPPGDWDSLLIAARQMDVDVLLWGGTHKFEAYEMEGKFFVNPGSATGAMTTGWWSEEEEPTPSFVLMDVSFLCHSTAPCDQEKGTEYDADKK
jgi:vacuolar protein sorting-associated protein 29